MNSVSLNRVYEGEYCAFSAFDKVVLRNLLEKIAKPGMQVLEVGSWLGNGSTAVMTDVAEQWRGWVYCVDTWQGSPNVARHQALAKEYDPFATFRANVMKRSGSSRVLPLIMSSAHAAALLRDQLFDLVFIDGDHAYSATCEDFRHWQSRVKYGGIFCGHDCETRLTPELDTYIRQSAEADAVSDPTGAHGCLHPSVILAVHERFGSAAGLAAEHPITGSDGIRGHATIWAIRNGEVSGDSLFD